MKKAPKIWLTILRRESMCGVRFFVVAAGYFIHFLYCLIIWTCRWRVTRWGRVWVLKKTFFTRQISPLGVRDRARPRQTSLRIKWWVSSGLCSIYARQPVEKLHQLHHRWALIYGRESNIHRKTIHGHVCDTKHKLAIHTHTHAGTKN